MNKTKVLSCSLALLFFSAIGGAAVWSLRPEKPASHAQDGGDESATSTATNGVATRARFDRARAPGLRHRYEMRFDQDVSLANSDGRPAASVRIRLNGALDVAFVGHLSGKHRLYAELGDVHVAIGEGGPSSKSAELERELSRPFWVVAETDGRVRGYSFPRGLSPLAQNLLRGVFGGAQIAARDEAEFVAEEDDLQGSYTASYSKDGSGATVKTKRPYAKLEGMASLDVRARSLASMAEDGFPTSVAFEEHAVAAMGANMPAATTDAHLDLKLTGTRADGALLGLYEREIDQLVDASPFGTTDDAESANIADRRLAGDASADAILEGARAAKDDAALIGAGDKLAARLRLAPSESDRVAALAKKLPAKEANVVVGALGAAKTRESTNALGHLVNDREGAPAVRANAATQLAFATGDNATDARDALAKGSTDASREVREASTLALGNVARELGDSDGETVHDLVARYDHARDDEERALLLEALGNTGSVEILPVVTTALAHANESVREAAAHALRFLPVGEGDKVLSRVLAEETSTTVIVAAVDSIGYRIVEMHARALERVVLADGAGRVRAAVAQITQRALSTRKGTLSNEAKAVLGALLQKARVAT